MKSLFFLRHPYWVVVAGSLSVVCLSIFAGHLQNLVANELTALFGLGEVGAFAVAAFLFLLLFIGFSLLTWHNRRRLFGVRLRDRDIDAVRKAGCLVFFVSRQSALGRAPGEAGGWRLHEQDLPDARAPVGEDGDSCRQRLHRLNDHISRITEGKPAFPWQQILRGVHPHIKHVRQIHLVGSSDPGGTFVAARDLAVSFLRDCLGKHGGEIEVVTDAECPAGVDFEDFEALKGLLSRVVDRAASSGVPETRTVIDVTGGLKVAAVTAAVLTLERDVTFQYVQTAARHPAARPRIRHYDIEFVSADSDGG